MRIPSLSLILSLSALVAACDLLPADIELDNDPSGTPNPEQLAAPLTAPVLHGLVVVGSDYVSTELYGLDTSTNAMGDVFLDSGSVAPVLSTALSGDVVLASSFVSTTTEIVVIDRFNSVLTILNADRTVGQQIALGEGGWTGVNPNDYVRVSDTKAYVSLYGTVYDDTFSVTDGDGIAVLNMEDGTRAARIDLSSLAVESDSTTGTVHPSPSGMFAVGDYVYVLLENNEDDWSGNGTAVLAIIDTATDTLATHLELTGLKNCTNGLYDRLAATVYVACVGSYSANQLAESGIAAVNVSAPANPTLIRIHAASDLANGTDYLSGSIALISSGRLAFVSAGTEDYITHEVFTQDRVWVLEYASADTATTTEIYTVEDSAVLSVASDANHNRLYIADGFETSPSVHTLSFAPTGATVLHHDTVSTGDRLPPRGIYPY